MTVATAFALDLPELTMVVVLSDSRVSWSDRSYAEIGVKAHDLGARVAVVSAGLAIVGPYAAEPTRSLIATSISAQQSIGLWDATRTFAYFARNVQRDLLSEHARFPAEVVDNEFVLAGYYADGTPGLAWIRLSSEREQVEFWRPGHDAFACFTIGASPAKEIVGAAYADFGRPDSRFGYAIEAVASAMLYAMRAEGTPFRTIGGGIAVGVCTLTDREFKWPTVAVDREHYYRGLPFPVDPSEDPATIMRLEVDTNYAAALDQRVEDQRHERTTPRREPRTYECSIDQLVGASPIRQTPEPPELHGVGPRR